MVESSRLLKRIAIIGAGRETLELLSVILRDPLTKVSIIVDPNPDALVFKLKELGYRLSPHLGIVLSTDPEDLVRLKQTDGIDIVVDSLQNHVSTEILQKKELRELKRISPLGARLLWSLNLSEEGGKRYGGLSYLYDMLDAGRLTSRYEELLSEILRLAIASSGAESGSIMLLDRDEGVLKIEVASGIDESIKRKVRVEVGEGICGKVVKEGKARIISGRIEGFPSLGRNIYNAVCVPLIADEEVIGVINVNSGVPEHIFTQSDRDFLQLLGELAAEAIKRSMEYEHMRLDAAKFSLWKELKKESPEGVPLEFELRAICRKIAELVPGLTCSLYILDKEGKRFITRASSVQDELTSGATTVCPERGFEGWVAKNKKDVVLVDRVEEEGLKRVYVALPLLSADKTIGVFSGQIISEKGLTKFYEAFLKDVSTLIAESISDKVKEERRLSHSRRMLSVDEKGLELLSMKESDSFVLTIATSSVELLDAEGCILRLDEDLRGEFKEAASFGLENKKIKQYFLAAEKDVFKEVLRTKDVVVRAFSRDENPYVRSIVSTPFLFHGNVVGILTFFNKSTPEAFDEEMFTEEDVDVLKRFRIYVERAFSYILEKKKGFIGSDTFVKRINEELNRARRYNKNLTVVTLSMNSNGVPGEAKKRFLKRLYSFIKKNIRSFDACAFLNENTIGILYPETDERVVSVLKKTIASAKGPAELKEGIHYGYAIYPKDGRSARELLERAYEEVELNDTLKTLQ